MPRRSFFALLICIVAAFALPALAADPTAVELSDRFGTTVRPFLQNYCVACHGKEKPEADLDLSGYLTMSAVMQDGRKSGMLLGRLKAGEMPPKEAEKQPSATERAAAVEWLAALRNYETTQNAGDPGIVLARRLSNSEYDYTIRDLTGVDIRPTREFPVDPANTAGFDNSGETLTMSPALLNKYLKAAHEVAGHMFLKPDGFGFAPYPMLVETDRDKYCVTAIIDLYHRQEIDLAAYFEAAWRFKNRAALGKPDAKLAEFAEKKISAKYLATVWSILEEEKADVGPLVKLQSMWKELPGGAELEPDAGHAGSQQMRDFVVTFRKKIEPRFLNLTGGGRGSGQGGGSTALLLWKNVQYATHRMTFDPGQLQVEGEPPTPPLDVANEPNSTGEFGPGKTVPVINQVGDPDLVVPAGERARYEAAFAKFCRVFPDKFYMEERGRNYFDTKRDRGRYLSAGFHSNVGYFRDDQPLYDLILDQKQQKELDDLWTLFDFIGDATQRMYLEGGGARPAPATAPGAAVVVDDPLSETMIKRAEARFLASASNEPAKQAGTSYYGWVNKTLRTMEALHLAAVPKQMDALQQFAARAYRRPLTAAEKSDLVAYYNASREKDGLDHETAMRESIVGILMSPDVCYRIDLVEGESGIHPLNDYDLASRLSYFLWSSMPDEQLLAHAAAGDLHEPKVIAAEARRMLKDPRSRALAVEFGANWLDIRRFEELSSVDRERFAAFTNELRSAMFEEPVRFMMDVFQNNRPVLDLLYANDTFVNPVLAKHYGIPVTVTKNSEWVHIQDAREFERGGLLPMAAFLTRNAPGLRTSPVKRGNWVVKNILGEHVPPPPPNVPELPRDETKLELPLREMLARHRNDAACASCHERIDALGLVFEGFGPIGDRRDKDAAGRAIDTSATFPGGTQGSGLEGLRSYIRDKRQIEFVDNFSGKLLAYAIGRSLIASDEPLIEQTRATLAADGYRFENVVQSVVTSKQFLTRRGRDGLAKGE